MRKVITICFIASGLTFSVGAFSAPCGSTGVESSSTPSGKEYPLRGREYTYSHDGDYRYQNKDATFMTSADYIGFDEYNYQDFKWRAKKAVTFPDRGRQWVEVHDPVSGIPHCNFVYVQNMPTISKVSWSTQTRRASVSYSIDAYSKFARQSKPRTITFRWREDLYGTQGIGATVSTSSLSGNATATLSFPGAGIYFIEATISDGTYTTSVPIGWLNIAGNVEPPCERCNKN